MPEVYSYLISSGRLSKLADQNMVMVIIHLHCRIVQSSIVEIGKWSSNVLVCGKRFGRCWVIGLRNGVW